MASGQIRMTPDTMRERAGAVSYTHLTTSVLTMLLGTSTVLSYCAAEHKKNENYNSILKEADKIGRATV